MPVPRILTRLVSRMLAAETRAIRLRPDLAWQLALPPGAAAPGHAETGDRKHEIIQTTSRTSANSPTSFLNQHRGQW